MIRELGKDDRPMNPGHSRYRLDKAFPKIKLHRETPKVCLELYDQR